MSKQSLLLVDGDPRSLRVLEVSLRKAGFVVATAESARAAQEKIVIATPDLIISEITLDDGDGFELCRRIRATPEWNDIPFMFLTGEVGIENKIRGLELGVDEYLTKPIYIKEIVTRINMLLQKRQRARIEERKDQRTRFVGRIADMPVVDVIQTIEVSRKSGVIHFVGERNRLAAIYFRDGRVIDAEAGPLLAEDAVYRLLTWSEGDFEVVFRTVRRRQVIAIGSQALLMEGMRRLDEWTRLLETLPPLTTHVDLRMDALAAKLGDIPDECNRLLRLIDGKRSLLDAIDACDLGDLEALQAVAQLHALDLLEQVEPVASEEAARPKISLESVVEKAKQNESGPLELPAVAASAQDNVGLAEAAPPHLSRGFRPSGLRLVDEAVAAAQAIDTEAGAWPSGDHVARNITGRARTHGPFAAVALPDPPELPSVAARMEAARDIDAPPRARTEPGIGTAPPPPAAESAVRDVRPEELPPRPRSITGQVQAMRTRTPPYGARISQGFAAPLHPFDAVEDSPVPTAEPSPHELVAPVKRAVSRPIPIQPPVATVTASISGRRASITGEHQALSPRTTTPAIGSPMSVAARPNRPTPARLSPPAAVAIGVASEVRAQVAGGHGVSDATAEREAVDQGWTAESPEPTPAASVLVPASVDADPVAREADAGARRAAGSVPPRPRTVTGSPAPSGTRPSLAPTNGSRTPEAPAASADVVTSASDARGSAPTAPPPREGELSRVPSSTARLTPRAHTVSRPHRATPGPAAPPGPPGPPAAELVDGDGAGTSAPEGAQAAPAMVAAPAEPRREPLAARPGRSTRPPLPPGSGTSVATARKRRTSPPAISSAAPTAEASAAPISVAAETSSAAVVAPDAARSSGVVAEAGRRRETQRMITSLGAATAEVSGEVESVFEARPPQTETQRQMVTILPRRATRELPVLDAPIEGPEFALIPEGTPARRKRTSSGGNGRRTTRELPAEKGFESGAPEQATRPPLLVRRRVTEPDLAQAANDATPETEAPPTRSKRTSAPVERADDLEVLEEQDAAPLAADAAAEPPSASAVASSWEPDAPHPALRRVTAVLFGLAGVLSIAAVGAWLHNRPARPPAAPLGLHQGAPAGPDAQVSPSATDPCPDEGDARGATSSGPENAGGAATSSGTGTGTTSSGMATPSGGTSSGATAGGATPSGGTSSGATAGGATPSGGTPSGGTSSAATTGGPAGSAAPELDPAKIARSLISKSRKALAAGDGAAALQLADEAIEQKSSARAHLARGLALIALERPADALASIDRAIAMSDNYADGWLSRGRVLETLGRTGESRAAFARYLELQPTGATADELRQRLAQ
ncbi:MAG: DUF4388 domain-containing protein [Kofleriaceae bacterium]